MKRMKALLVLAMLAIQFCGCKSSDDNTVGIDTAQTDLVEDNKIEDDSKGENMVTLKEFRDYYGDTIDDIPDEYIASFLDTYHLTTDDLARATWDAVIIRDYSENRVFGCNVDDILSENKNTDDLDSFLENINRVVVIATLPNNDETVSNTYSVLEVEKHTIYQFNEPAVRLQYVKADISYDIASSAQDYDEKISEVAHAIDENQYLSTDKYYSWILVLEDKNHTIKRYEIIGDDRGDKKLLYEFLAEYMKIDFNVD